MTLRAAKKRLRNDSAGGIKDLRDISVLVMHPDDEDGRNLIAQLQRIGCQVRVQWPIPERLHSEADVIVLAVSPESLSTTTPWLLHHSTPPIIPVIAYENPIIVEALVQLNACSVIPSPVRSFGLLTALAITLSQARKTREREKHVKRLEGRMAVMRTVQQAKIILMETKGLSETDAYNALRDQAMAKREPVEKIAEALVKAHELFQQACS
ncbi:ANTAR domain-containing response regulator [Pseudomonas syringae]|uniref:ANTAR domain-containing response regulator n=1 Tax=Pseudomonas syringae TaxID=317 RepID=UPI001F286EF6|nr:ANTAR domain-containing protein [Pseudomonas syringae]MCF5733277.1 ANTAR domain-containing protein [Pseudomonas syringae]MCF5741974.1 ANTAR domain-containing protein [Pseudomonas syringae]MCF5752815.1 ANTAR domain-containing protein [Pseudomonas syringae]MCF5754923.1 ANTAR domain-containing protein [Pseudomonas syringae]